MGDRLLTRKKPQNYNQSNDIIEAKLNRFISMHLILRNRLKSDKVRKKKRWLQARYPEEQMQINPMLAYSLPEISGNVADIHF